MLLNNITRSFSLFKLSQQLKKLKKDEVWKLTLALGGKQIETQNITWLDPLNY